MAFFIFPGGCLFIMQLRTIVFFDGQNLYHGVKDAWGHTGKQQYFYPSFDVEKLANSLVQAKSGCVISQIRFYTGVPAPNLGLKDKFWHSFWSNKLRYLKNRGIVTYKGRLNRSRQEKGVDVSIAVDLIRFTYEKSYDVALVISQDWDFGPAIKLAKQIAKDQNRNLQFESYFPYGLGSASDRGIPGTVWNKIDQNLYDSCIDQRDYRS